MARDHARIQLTIWDDDDFRALSPAAQHLYFVLTIHPSLSYAGVADWRPARLTGFSAAWTVEAVEIAAQELSEALYIVIDAATEEVLIRSFIRNDDLMESPNMAVAMRKAHRAVASTVLRGVIVHELIRLHDDKPQLKGWAKVGDLLERPSVDPSEIPSFQASENPSVSLTPNPSGNPSGNPSPTPNSILPAPAPDSDSSVDGDLEGDRYETLRASLGTKPPRCTEHPDGNSPVPCTPCRRVREWTEKRDALARERARRARQDCPDCGGSVWLDNGEKCKHPKTRRTA